MRRTRTLRTASKRVVQVSQKSEPCVQCHKMSSWLSVDRLCWDCLKSAMKKKKPHLEIEPLDLYEEDNDSTADWSSFSQ
jgi:hypothetical protein